MGNEKGFANETCWATYSPVGADGGPASPGDVNAKLSTTGDRNGKLWLPAECDVSIRPGWFWHEKENDKVKSPATLLDLYYKSVGRGGSFLLNIPPDRRGLLHENDVASLKGFGELLRGTFRENLARTAQATASNVRGKAKEFGAANLLDGDRFSYWSTDDGVTTAEVELRLKQAASFNVIRVREDLRLGQRVDEIAIDAWVAGAWQQVAQATSIGSCRILRTSQMINADRVRLRVNKAAAAPALSEFGLYAEAKLS